MIDDLPPLREVVAAHGLAPKRSLGQNFLFDLNLTARIARAAGPLDGVTVVEVGPGPGGLTRALLSCGAERVVAIERDARCRPALEQIALRYPGRLSTIDADAMQVDIAEAVGPQAGPVRIVANLPYNVGTALLVGWITAEAWPPRWQQLTLMFQKEVAQRIVADERRPSDYGRLGVLCGWRTEASILFDVAASAFVPPPKVTSTVVQLTPRLSPAPCRLGALEVVTQAAFGQRRKMLRQSLKSLRSDPLPLIEAAGLDPTARAETIPVAGFVRLARALDGQTA
ncbi:16S rRNA (adenine(1518)-N(6)/adenine(1519)-N(6))-dimethyltransferase RsmA [Chelatococcus reniformis]|uniref:Ribosomal RNA small subunit methyltransferase A n=1 Tax=Chelatococcus reniformis TaxID=1494448 RepID=A0A916XF57_9HYPH|nr:16S rRNA (adenine(1518)-N(6)/adenine(1519)-N(6))-dimethyltransferase RsmA [Chelatococcus reniformis]GGC69098.1 ribosomal RNA small subunit methyltransferase A [Chelatococcus reniformis]